MDVIRRRFRGRQIDIAGIAERGDHAALLERAGIERDSRQARAGEFDQREIVRRIDRDDAALIALAALRRDDPNHDIAGITRQQFHDMRVGDDPVRRDRNPAAVPEADHFIIDDRDRHDAHDAAPGRRNIVGMGGGGKADRGDQCEGQEPAYDGHHDFFGSDGSWPAPVAPAGRSLASPLVSGLSSSASAAAVPFWSSVARSCWTTFASPPCAL